MKIWFIINLVDIPRICSVKLSMSSVYSECRPPPQPRTTVIDGCMGRPALKAAVDDSVQSIGTLSALWFDAFTIDSGL